MQKVLDVNNLTRLNSDYCEKESRIRNNQKIKDYNLNSCYSTQSRNRKNYLDAANEIGLYQTTNYDGRGVYVDNGSKLRNGISGNIITSEKPKDTKLLNSRPFATTPFKGAGYSTLKHPDIKSKLMIGQLSRKSKKNMDLAGVSIDRFIPMVSCLKKNIQDPKHLIPKYWVRGGMDTRTIVRNINYLKSCGLKPQ